MPAYALASTATSTMPTTGSTQNETKRNKYVHFKSNPIEKYHHTIFRTDVHIVRKNNLDRVEFGIVFFSLLSCSYLFFLIIPSFSIPEYIVFVYCWAIHWESVCLDMWQRFQHDLQMCRYFFSIYFGILMHALMTAVVTARVIYMIISRKLTSNVYRDEIVVTSKGTIEWIKSSSWKQASSQTNRKRTAGTKLFKWKLTF